MTSIPISKHFSTFTIISQGVGDYEAAFSDEELTENATENATEKKSGLGSPKQSSDNTVTSASDVSHDEDGQEHPECTNGKQEHATGGTASSLSSNSSIKDVKYYYFYQGTHTCTWQKCQQTCIPGVLSCLTCKCSSIKDTCSSC